jgi:hypothetical protein
MFILLRPLDQFACQSPDRKFGTSAKGRLSPIALRHTDSRPTQLKAMDIQAYLFVTITSASIQNKWNRWRCSAWLGHGSRTSRNLDDNLATYVLLCYRLCDLVVRVLGYRPEVRFRFPALPDFLRSSESGTGSTQPREYNWGVTWKK